MSKLCFREAGFTVRKWGTNEPKLREVIEEECKVIDGNDVSYAKDLFGTSIKYRKVLGINWDIPRDELVMEFSAIAKTGLQLPFTKRNILKTSASFFDPIGLISPIVLQVKLLFKQII